MNEIWKPIPGYEGYYSASNLGRIRRDKKEANTYSGRIMRQSSKGRYARVGLTKLGKAKHESVHRLVAKTFLKNRKPDKPYVNHKNGNRKDNTLKNLEWCSAKENMKHSLEHGLQPQGSRAYNAKLSEDDVIAIRRKYIPGKVSQQSIADEYKVSQLLISIIIRRKRWRHI